MNNSCLFLNDRTKNASSLRHGVEGHGFLSHLIEAEDGDLPADVDARRADAEDAVALQASLGVDGSGGDGGRQGRRHDNGHDVQRSDDERLPRRLDRDAGGKARCYFNTNGRERLSHLHPCEVAYVGSVQDHEAVDGPEKSWRMKECH